MRVRGERGTSRSADGRGKLSPPADPLLSCRSLTHSPSLPPHPLLCCRCISHYASSEQLRLDLAWETQQHSAAKVQLAQRGQGQSRAVAAQLQAPSAG